MKRVFNASSAMNADTFNFESHSPTCPICHRVQVLPLEQLNSGLYICPYCQQRLVVSKSGHYVRDPFMLKPFISSQLLRRQSHPLARAIRDCGSAKPPYWMTVMVSIVLFSFALAATERLKPVENPIPHWIEEGSQIMRSLHP